MIENNLVCFNKYASKRNKERERENSRFNEYIVVTVILPMTIIRSSRTMPPFSTFFIKHFAGVVHFECANELYCVLVGLHMKNFGYQFFVSHFSMKICNATNENALKWSEFSTKATNATKYSVLRLIMLLIKFINLMQVHCNKL